MNRNYEDIIELNNVTVGDCLDWNKYIGGYVLLNDGRVINFVKYEKEENNI